MLNQNWHGVLLFGLRHVLFLGPLFACIVLMWKSRDDGRMITGAIFSLLYGLPVVFLCHVVAIRLGLWSYGGEILKIEGFPADIWFGGVFLWGPVCFLAFPKARQWLAPTAFVLINGLMLPLLAPFVTAGHYWFAGVVVVFLIAHLPALYLAQWTWHDIHLPRRAFLLAMGFAPFAFFLIPTIIMQAMGGGWDRLAECSKPGLALSGSALLFVAVLGWSGVQMFCLYGDGTPIPLDPTKRLVHTGIYAYIANPMQLSTALGFAILGLTLGNPWVFSGSIMSVVFVLGMVRWHQRNDLAKRFPEGWPLYRANVPEWMPRWRPWRKCISSLSYDPHSRFQSLAVRLIQRLKPVGLELSKRSGPLVYQDGQHFAGLAAFAQALSLGNFVSMLAGAGILLFILPLRYLGSLCRAAAKTAVRN